MLFGERYGWVQYPIVHVTTRQNEVIDKERSNLIREGRYYKNPDLRLEQTALYK